MMGTDLFVYHGFTEFYLEGKWVMALPPSTRTLPEAQGRPSGIQRPRGFIFQPYNLEKRKFMEYVAYHAPFRTSCGENCESVEEAYGRTG